MTEEQQLEFNRHSCITGLCDYIGIDAQTILDNNQCFFIVSGYPIHMGVSQHYIVFKSLLCSSEDEIDSLKLRLPFRNSDNSLMIDIDSESQRAFISNQHDLLSLSQSELIRSLELLTFELEEYAQDKKLESL